MEKAKQLLDTTNFSSNRIASMVGYSDPNYFSITFKKRYGKSPLHYRNEGEKHE
jgi:two-component system response regulator YesN